MCTTDPPHFPLETPESVSWHRAGTDGQAGHRPAWIGPASTIAVHPAIGDR